MRNAIKEFIEPSDYERHNLWENAIFVFDTNVLLNLYRYSAKTRNSLLDAFESFKDRIWIPYQVLFHKASQKYLWRCGRLQGHRFVQESLPDH